MALTEYPIQNLKTISDKINSGPVMNNPNKSVLLGVWSSFGPRSTTSILKKEDL